MHSHCLRFVRSFARQIALVWSIVVLTALSANAVLAELPVPTEMEQLVQQLQSPQRDVRQRAEEKLITLKSDSLPVIETSLASFVNDTDLRLALIRVQRAIQIQLAQESLAEISLCKFSATGTFSPAADASQQGILRVKIRLDVAPSVRAVDVLFRDADLLFELGKVKCEPVSPDARRELACEENSTEFTVNYRAPVQPEPRTGHLTGHLELKCLAGLKEVTFPLTNVAAESQFVGRTEARLLSASCGEGGLTAKLLVAFEPGTKWESYRAEILHQEIGVQFADGTRLPCPDIELQEVRGAFHTVICRFPEIHTIKAGDLLFDRLPALVATVSVPIDLPGIFVTQ